MKKVTVIITILMLCFSAAMDAQVKKPRLVVIPSNKLLSKMECLTMGDDMGEPVQIPEYDKALLDDDLGACITKINEMFNDRGFPLTNLESELQRIKGKGPQVIPVDIRIELNYKVTTSGPRKIMYLELAGIDNYSSKQIAGASGESQPAIGATTVNLLQEAVLAKIDKFQDDIQNYFEKMAVNGRESRLTISSPDGAISDDIADAVEAWLDDNCVKGSYSIDDVTEETIRVSQAMMPLFAGEKPLDAYNFYKPLVELLKTKSVNAKANRSAMNSNSRGGTLGDCNITVTM